VIGTAIIIYIARRIVKAIRISTFFIGNLAIGARYVATGNRSQTCTARYRVISGLEGCVLRIHIATIECFAILLRRALLLDTYSDDVGVRVHLTRLGAQFDEQRGFAGINASGNRAITQGSPNGRRAV